MASAVNTMTTTEVTVWIKVTLLPVSVIFAS